MPVFVVIPDLEKQQTEARIRERFTNQSYRLPQGEWLVAFNGTTKELSDLLGISQGENGASAFVVAIAGYYGRAPSDIWEWLNARVNASPSPASLLAQAASMSTTTG